MKVGVGNCLVNACETKHSLANIIMDAFIKHQSTGKTTCSKGPQWLKYSHQVVNGCVKCNIARYIIGQ